MMLIKIEDGNPVGNPITNESFFALFPNTSFPFPLTPDDVDPFGYGMYDFTSQPTPGTYEKVVEVNPVKDEQGIWRQTWQVVPMTPAEVEEKNTQLRAQTKQQASTMLTETDWVELGDVSDPANPPYLANKAEFTAYRAALRAIAVNPPITVDPWPTKPEEVWSDD